MAKNIDTIAGELGARIAGTVPEVSGGAFGAARLARVVEQLRSRLVPGQGRRLGRPTDARWVKHPKVPMSESTQRRLVRLAEKVSGGGRKISPMQLAAQILEDALAGLGEDNRPR
jgi:hypothetical protein